jgi:hypothetical protein
MGPSEANTKAILATTIGKVLIIDEAYMLSSSSGGSGGPGGADIYKTAVIDTMVAEIYKAFPVRIDASYYLAMQIK